MDPYILGLEEQVPRCSRSEAGERLDAGRVRQELFAL